MIAKGGETSAPLARRYADAGLALVVVLVVAMMIVPLPTPLLDVLIAGNISVAVLLLLVALYVRDALGFTSFPTLLLVTTLFRLALNVSSTRLILLQGDAGEVIRAFGAFVVRGNYVVGAVVFLVLTLIQFLVIAKGAERVAEVGARFTLDAMPGKQMAIDAELRTGAIGQDDARRRRRLVQRESQLYGAMDGAMKFVKGDAIAGIVITVINVVGGLAIGVGMRGLSAVDSLRLYGLLTIGDGLVSQIPSLLVSTAAGIVVTRVASEDDETSLATEVATQIFGNPRAMAIAGGFVFLIGLVPGMPTVPFWVLALVFLGGSYRLRKAASRAEAQGEAPVDRSPQRALAPGLVPITLDVSASLFARLGGRHGLLDEDLARTIRERVFAEVGVTIPAIRVRLADDPAAPHRYALTLLEVPVAQGDAVADGVTWLGEHEGTPLFDGEDPITGRAARWFAPPATRGDDAIDASEFVARHLTHELVRRAADFLGLQETQSMLDQLEKSAPALVRNVVPKPVGLPLLADVLRRLVEERISVRPLREILECLAIHGATERDPVALTEAVRSSLRRQVSHRLAPSGELAVMLVDPLIEDTVRDAIQRTPGGSYLALGPQKARDIVAAFRRALDAQPTRVVLTQSDVRRYVRRLIEVDFPDVTVLSYQEIDPRVRAQPVARITP